MTGSPIERAGGIAPGRLAPAAIAENFADVHPPLDDHEALVASDRCYFCYDAPCVTACPTAIDIPLFIRQISTGTSDAAAETIFDQNILGGMCARVCPTEQLCEQACVREIAEGKPVEIGALQRYATDGLMEKRHPYTRAASTGKRVAVVGAGPAGLACAHRLALLGNAVTIFDRRSKPGGLNEYGIAAYKTVDDFAQREVDWLMGIGGITLETNKSLGDGVSLTQLQSDFDAVFLGIGKTAVNALTIDGVDKLGVEDAVAFIDALRQAKDKSEVAVGRKVVVIGGGMTAVDAAVQSKALGAEEVTIAYRRSQERMSASPKEQAHAQRRGVRIATDATPAAIKGNGSVTGVAFTYSDSDGGEVFEIAADQVMLAIGQKLGPLEGLNLDSGAIAVDGQGRTSVGGVWAGGDCASGGDDLTVTAVAEGRDAAISIHETLNRGV